MAIQKLGKVSIMVKGNYNSSENYEKLDLITFNGASYLCKKPCSGIEPIPGADTEYWQPFGQSVVVASQDKTGIVRPDGTSLVVKDSVTGRIGVGDAQYIPFENEIMAAGNVSDAFVELDARIDEVQESISDIWNASNTYLVGKYCIYNNSLWKCKVQHTNQTPTEGTYWTKVSVANEISSVNSNLESVNSSLSDVNTKVNAKVPRLALNGGFPVVAYSKRNVSGSDKLECLENWILNALSQYNGNMCVIGAIYGSGVDGFATVNVWGDSSSGILGASGILTDQSGVYYYKKLNGSSGSGTLTKINPT